MSSNTPLVQVPTEALAKIDDDLDSLEECLEPLFSKPLNETLDKLSTIHKAKLCTLIPYVVHSLSLIYLKTNGGDPKSHPVMEEMKRVRSYMEKITQAEKGKEKSAKLDTEVASRFINHAIASANAHNKRVSSKTIGVIGNHLRFNVEGQVMTEEAAEKIAARMKVDDEEDEESSEEGDELEVVGGALEGDVSSQEAKADEDKEGNEEGAGGSNAETPKEEASFDPLYRAKRKRPKPDLFAEYDDASAPSSGQGTPAAIETEDSEAANSASGNGKSKRRRKTKGKQTKSKLKDSES